MLYIEENDSRIKAAFTVGQRTFHMPVFFFIETTFRSTRGAKRDRFGRGRGHREQKAREGPFQNPSGNIFGKRSQRTKFKEENVCSAYCEYEVRPKALMLSLNFQFAGVKTKSVLRKNKTLLLFLFTYT